MSAEDLAEMRVVAPERAAVEIDGERFYPLAWLPQIRVDLREQEQAVAIDLPATAFRRRSESLMGMTQLAMTPTATGGFVNYDVVIDQRQGRVSGSGAFEMGFSTPAGVALSGFIASAGSGSRGLSRLESSWSIDRPLDATSIRLGDAITSGGPGAAPYRFAGVQYHRNFAVQPGFITMPLPVASGSAAVPSVVDIYVNNILQSSRNVDPGPFELQNIPVQSGGGNVQVVVRDLLGRQVVTEQAYYASNLMLRRGLHDFSYEAGFLRRDFAGRNDRYGQFMASMTQRYGFTDHLTGEAVVQASARRQLIGLGVNASVFDLGRAGVSASASRSDQGTGYRASANFEHRGRGLSFGGLAEYASRNYGFIGMPADFRLPRLTLQAFADTQIGRATVGANFLHRDMRGDAPSETLAGLSGTMQISDRMLLQLYARRTVIGQPQTVFGAHVSLALGGRRSGYAIVEHGSNGVSGEMSFQEGAPSGVGGGFRATASFGAFERFEAAYTRNLAMASVSAEVSRVGTQTGFRATASGALGMVGSDMFASRNLGQSFASVQVGDYPGVRVYADNQLVGRTGSDGTITIPQLRPYEPNVIRIDEADLPMDAMLDTNEVAVRPYSRSGVRVRFDLRRERGVLMQVRLDDGTFLPVGAEVTFAGASEPVIAVTDGEIYFPSLSGTKTLRARWGDQSCEFTATVPNDADPQPRLSGLVCVRERRFAAR
jgi:outer membrane usher protein